MVTKIEVGYQEESPDPSLICGKCQNFLAPNKCKIVSGQVSPMGTCGLFAPISDQTAIDELLFGGSNVLGET